jgi:hypothetical protein
VIAYLGIIRNPIDELKIATLFWVAIRYIALGRIGIARLRSIYICPDRCPRGRSRLGYYVPLEPRGISLLLWRKELASGQKVDKSSEDGFTNEVAHHEKVE